ncbi:MACPF domain-containing CAD1-like protein [Heracleum sosnowskyi]|uniref:MACPF domain-containing CAD1-like protein n=1 Tax=Heracleum sosnowskyi TaxID=360622 RepID=A0AAD8HXX7_9APIA|nr:MACPF domain-containing CAD1-like protein [Heracleum sosnowskyi]
MASPQEALAPTNKRPLEINTLQDSRFFKIRAICKDLRPHFIQVLRTPDFQNCKAASEIQEKLKVMMDLYEEMIADTNISEKSKNVPQIPPLSDENPVEAKSDRGSMKLPDDKSVLSGHILESQQTETVKLQGTYIVGGSAFGWNFITFPSTKAIYYGRTKEAFRLQNPLSM